MNKIKIGKIYWIGLINYILEYETNYNPVHIKTITNSKQIESI